MFDLPRLTETNSENNENNENNINYNPNRPTSNGVIPKSISSIHLHRAAIEPENRNNISEDVTPVHSPESEGGSTAHYRKIRKAYSQNDLKSMGSISARSSNIYRTVALVPDIRHHNNQPSTKAEKLKMTRRYFATVIGLCYAIFLVVFGAVAFVGNAIVDQHPLAEVFGIYMLVLSFIYFLYLYIDIRLHISNAKKSLIEREKRIQAFEEGLAKSNNNYNLDLTIIHENGSDGKIPVPYDLPPLRDMSHKYCFKSGRHGEFFYLKLGAAWFALGLLIDSILQIAYQIVYLSSDASHGYDCASGVTLALDIIFPIYSIFILFFIYKYINVVINVRRELARLMLMHAIGTSLAFWIYTIVRETKDAIIIADEDYKKDENGKPQYPYENTDPSAYDKCLENGNLNYIRRTFSPYLYPFAIEFSILIVGIWYIMWSHINSCPKKEQQHGKISGDQYDAQSVIPGFDNPKEKEETCETDHDNEFKTTTFIYADCHASQRGLFAGLVLIVVTIVFIILFFVAVNDDNYLYTGVTINTSFELTVLIIMSLCVLCAYYQTAKLDVNTHPISMVDDVLLFVAIPAFFLEIILAMVPAIYNGSVLNICRAMAQIIQVLLQTPFIIDGMRRCANDFKIRQNKPGRELVMFLTVANVSSWIFYTFSVKGTYKGDERYEFYGYTTFNILNHVSQPLIMFYRFHASVCLVDIWRHSYEPAPTDHH